MIRRALVAVLALGCVNTAAADWLGDVGVDPMTDHKWAAVAAAFGDDVLPAVVLKCWQDGRVHLDVVTGRYNESASYAPRVIRLRVDQHLPHTILTTPKNLGGNLTLKVSNDEFDLASLLTQLRDAKTRVALSIGDAVFETDVRGASKAVDTMFATCSMRQSAAD